jgi:hypothetical protein
MSRRVPIVGPGSQRRPLHVTASTRPLSVAAYCAKGGPRIPQMSKFCSCLTVAIGLLNALPTYPLRYLEEVFSKVRFLLTLPLFLPSFTTSQKAKFSEVRRIAPRKIRNLRDAHSCNRWHHAYR